MKMYSSLKAVLLAITGLLVCRSNSKRRRSSQPPPRHRTRQVQTASNNNSDVSSPAIGESASFDPSLNPVSMAELLQATENFSPDLIIGDGSFGLVYKAKLSSGVTVALKKLSAHAFEGFRQFQAEMETLGKLRHPNIVQILGYCATGSERVLVYEFIEKGSLDQWLYDTSSSSSSSTEAETENDYGEVSDTRLPLSWETRIKIIKGVSKGLAYMHNLEKAVVHRDIKPSNVLLDKNFEAHIADFGLARIMEGSKSHVSTQAAGTMGYMPPECLYGTAATVMGDVYSFGVLSLEIITGRRPNFPFAGEDGKEVRLIEWVNTMINQRRYMEMIDGDILKEELIENVVTEIFRIATTCVCEKPRIRPTMNQVVEMLDKICSKFARESYSNNDYVNS